MTKIRHLHTGDFNFVSSEDVTLWQVGRTTEGLINQQANIDEEYISIEHTPKENGKIRVVANGASSHNVINDNTRIKFIIDDSVLSPTRIKNIRNVEHKDSAGTGQVLNVIAGGIIIGNVNNSTDNESDFSGSLLHDVVAGVTYTIKVVFNSQSANDEMAILHSVLGYQKFE